MLEFMSQKEPELSAIPAIKLKFEITKLIAMVMSLSCSHWG
jgi:hypothetical protein